MFCPNCGSPNSETATRCGSCGIDVDAGPPAQRFAATGAPMPPLANHLVFAIVITVVGAMSCLPVAIAGGMGIFYASQVNSKLIAGDAPGAALASKYAKRCSVIGLVMLVVCAVAFMGLMGFAIAAENM